MPKTFFTETAQAQLEDTIRQFLVETARLAACKAGHDELIKRQKKIQDYLDNPKYIKLSDRLKRALHKAGKELETELHEEAPVRMEDVAATECFIQIPADKDLSQIRGMPAGAEEDQKTRLTHMSDVVKTHATVPVLNTDELQLNACWQELFALIDQGKKAAAYSALEQMAQKDVFFRLILTIHPIEYIAQIVEFSIDAQRSGMKKINADVVLTPKSFEVLIKDIAVTVQHPAKVYCSFGLPSHHAYSDMGSGFCIFNKIAILIQHAEYTKDKPLKYVIIGTDVNRDNGLCQVLRQSAAHLDLTHIDIFDSRVYPQEDIDSINKELAQHGQELQTGITSWPYQKTTYIAVDLTTCIRSKSGIHPALLFAIHQLEEQIKHARTNEQKIMLYLPSGWDSHEEETAYCGKFIDGKMMSTLAAKKHRFNNHDLLYFYQQIITLYQNNKEYIAGIYWGLEGGYDRTMYEQQIVLMLSNFTGQLTHDELPAYTVR